ncbi:GGDEF domain-containing protein [Nostoc sp. 3335mG]|nr:GGDEF domain-containing protein [Nostoc sp. 3335mG]
MQAYAIISGTMLVISLILSGAMAIAWISLGRQSHALSWSLAYLCYGVEILAQVIEATYPATAAFIGPVELLFVLTPAALVAIGGRQRAGLPPRYRPFAAATLAALFVGDLPYLFPGHLGWTSTTSGLFTIVMLLIAASAILPRNRRVEPAEWAVTGAISVFILFELLLIVTDLASQVPGHPERRDLFLTLYLVGLTPVFVANGIGAILLLASDVAAQLRTLAANDPLTGVLNRRGFHEAALRAVANGRRQRQSISVAIADIDHFKNINDRHGHTVGDRTLGFVCGRLTQGLRGGDLVGRIGGEEFALLLVNSSAEQAGEAMERIRADIAAGFSEDGAPAPVTTSFGVARVPLGTGTPDQMLAEAMDRADKALYRSKVEGRNRTTIAD